MLIILASLHPALPPIHNLAILTQAVRGHVSLRVQQLDVLCDTKTKDNVFVQLQVSCGCP